MRGYVSDVIQSLNPKPYTPYLREMTIGILSAFLLTKLDMPTLMISKREEEMIEINEV